jgi:putative methyltransferase (TIGR04325 family)
MKDAVTIWSGVYSSFDEVPACGPGFNGDTWVENSVMRAKTLRETAEKGRTIPSVTEYRESLLPVIAGMVYSDLGRARILDYGGGMGMTYYQVAECLPEKKDFEYHIVETGPVCTAGMRFFRSEPSVHFHTDLPEHPETMDIVHMGSSLHYIKDWAGILSRLCNYRPEYFLFTDLPAGDIPTYASGQRYYESRIPVWFFNIEEIVTEMAGLGFSLRFRSSYISRIQGKEQPFPQENFQDKYRLGNSCILLFRRKEGQ